MRSISCLSLLLYIIISSVSSFQVSRLIVPKDFHLRLRHQHHVSSQLSSIINANNLETLSAVAAIGCSSWIGMKVNDINISKKLGKLSLEGVGHIVAIIAASHFSSLGISPSSHRFYDICWKCLPASLSLLLLSPIVEDNEVATTPNGNKMKIKKIRVRDATRKEIMAVSIPFVIGCIGSILGCILSFFFCWLGRNNHVRAHKRIFAGRQHYLFQPGKLLYEPSEAAVAAGCLISSYIGGSLNYFASAKIIASETIAKDAAYGVLSGTFGSVASDMLIMPIYFSTLASITSSQRIRKLFPGRATTKKMVVKEKRSSNLTLDGVDQVDMENRRTSRRSQALLTAILLPLVAMIVVVSDAFEARLQVHGLGLLCICLLSSLVANMLQPFLTRCALSDIISQVTLKMSNACYFILMSVIGISINLRCLTLESGWSSASSVIFSAVPLLVHFVVIGTGSLAMMKLFPRLKLFPLSVEEIVVASNTAICGPATAAALVSKMASSSDKKFSKATEWKGLALAGTFWGIMGYALGTTIGVSLSRALLSVIL